MRINRNLVGLAAVGAVAFVAGRADWLVGATPTAEARVWQEEGEMTAEMMAWMEAGTPGDHHRHLDQLTGDWEAVFKFWMTPGAPPMESRGTIKRKWMLDGRYLQEKVEASSAMGDFKGLGYLGYNNIDGQYEFMWIDSMSTAMMTETGLYDADAKVMVTTGSHRDPVSGRVVNRWGRLDMSNPDRHVFTGYEYDENGKKRKTFEGVAERVTE
jgi:hypothetical protein